MSEKKIFKNISEESKRLNIFCKLCKTKEYFINKNLNVTTFALLPFAPYTYPIIVNAYKYINIWIVDVIVDC